MKTLIKSLVFGGVLLLFLSPLLSDNLNAQSLHNNNQFTDNFVEKDLINPQNDHRPNKLILIYDTTSLTFEFTENGELALIYTCSTLHSQYAAGGTSSKASSKIDLSENYIKSIMGKAVTENVDNEEDMELQEWMIHPEGWLKN
jgi:hypothetical protein